MTTKNHMSSVAGKEVQKDRVGPGETKVGKKLLIIIIIIINIYSPVLSEAVHMQRIMNSTASDW